MAIRFSLAGNAGERGFHDQVERAALMEELGYHGIFFSESLMSGLDPFQVLAVAAMRTIEQRYRDAGRELTLEEWRREPWRSTFLDGLARLTSALN